MNLFFMGLIYPKEDYFIIASKCKTGMQNQVDSFQKLIIDALEESPLVQNLFICNSLPVGNFPFHYGDLYLPAIFNGNIKTVACLNLPYFKQKMREDNSYAELMRWLKADAKNRDVLLYSLYLPYMKAAVKAKKDFPDLKLGIIVPDIPTDLGLSSGRCGLGLWMEQNMAQQSVELCKHFDYFVLLTKHMENVLPISMEAKCVVVEAIAPNELKLPSTDLVQKTYRKYGIPAHRPSVVYTGTLQEELGILSLIEAFDLPGLQNVNLVLAGAGNLADTVKAECGKRPNCYYTGFIEREKAINLQMGASVLVNPRKNTGKYTAYSFPSKTMEYMLSAKPVVCFPLDGIPKDYDEHLYYIHSERQLPMLIEELLHKDPEELARHGIAARYFVLENKNARVQVAKILSLYQERYLAPLAFRSEHAKNS